MLTVAYYNLGVEYEFIADLNEAIHSITQAISIAKTHLGTQHPLYRKIDESKKKLIEKWKLNR